MYIYIIFYLSNYSDYYFYFNLSKYLYKYFYLSTVFGYSTHLCWHTTSKDGNNWLKTIFSWWKY